MFKKDRTKKAGSSLWLALIALFGIIILVLLMKSIISPSVAQTSFPQPKFAANSQNKSGDLRDYMQHIIETELPTKGSQIFTEPTSSEVKDFMMIIKYMEQNQNNKAQALAGKYNYSVITFTDTGYKDNVYGILKENTPYTRAWGIFIIRPGASLRNVIVEAPHPIDDQYTGKVGVDLFRHLGAKKLFIAGSDRYAKRDNSSDTARNPRSMFHLLSVQFTDGNDWIIQPHGFNKTADDPDIIVSAGTTDEPSFLPQINAAIKHEGLDSRYFDKEINKLGATTNTQGQDIRAKGGKFVHVESSIAIRSNYKHYNKMIKALETVIPVNTKVNPHK